MVRSRCVAITYGLQYNQIEIFKIVFMFGTVKMVR